MQAVAKLGQLAWQQCLSVPMRWAVRALPTPASQAIPASAVTIGAGSWGPLIFSIFWLFLFTKSMNMIPK